MIGGAGGPALPTVTYKCKGANKNPQGQPQRLVVNLGKYSCGVNKRLL
jgi:hypothetical protein